MYFNSHVFDIVGACFSFLSVIYSIRGNYLTWPAGLIAILIGMVLYLQKGLYADVGLHLFYLALTFYGWFLWKRKREKHSILQVSKLKPKLMYILIGMVVFAIAAIAAILYFCTDSKVPVWDASTTVMSLVADWLMCRKIIQCWHLWFVVDGLFAGMYFYKGIPAHALLYLFYVSLAVVGYWRWKSTLATTSAIEI